MTDYSPPPKVEESVVTQQQSSGRSKTIWTDYQGNTVNISVMTSTKPSNDAQDMDTALARRFKELVRVWKAETGHLSLVKHQTSSLSFLRIIKLGDAALPLMLEEFRRLPISAWLVALEVIADDNPASDAKSYKEAVQLWLTWGEDHGHIQ